MKTVFTEAELQACLDTAVKYTVQQLLDRMVQEGLVSRDGVIYQSIAQDYGVKQ